METPDDEIFVRLVLFRGDWVDARKHFELARSQSDAFIRDALLKMAIIYYSKPFMDSTGISSEFRKFRLPKSIVPDDYIWLHETFLNYRGNFISHSNFKTMRPILAETNKPGIPIIYTGISFDHWFEVDDEFPQEPKIIDEAINLTTSLIDSIYPDTKESAD